MCWCGVCVWVIVGTCCIAISLFSYNQCVTVLCWLFCHNLKCTSCFCQQRRERTSQCHKTADYKRAKSHWWKEQTAQIYQWQQESKWMCQALLLQKSKYLANKHCYATCSNATCRRVQLHICSCSFSTQHAYGLYGNLVVTVTNVWYISQ